MLARKLDVAVLFGRTGGPAQGWPGVRARCTPRRVPATLFAASTTRKYTLTRKTLTLFPTQALPRGGARQCKTPRAVPPVPAPRFPQLRPW
eukprot:662512-Pyramimonas_sp.AAC.1